MNDHLHELSTQLSGSEKDESDQLAELFKSESGPGPEVMLNRCMIWDRAKYLSELQFDYFAAVIGIQSPSIYSFVLDTMSKRYRDLTKVLGPRANAGAALSMISMFGDDAFQSAVSALQSHGRVNADELLKAIADAAWEKHNNSLS